MSFDALEPSSSPCGPPCELDMGVDTDEVLRRMDSFLRWFFESMTQGSIPNIEVVSI